MVSLGAFIASMMFLSHYREEELESELHDVEQLVAPVVANHVTEADLAAPMPQDRQDVVLGMILGEHRIRLQGLRVWALDGVEILAGGDVPTPATEDARAVASGGAVRRERLVEGTRWLDAYVPLRLEEDGPVVGIVGARLPTAHIEDEASAVTDFLYRTLGGSLGLAFLAMVTILYLGQHGIRQREAALVARSREIAQARHEIALAVIGALDLRDTETEGHSLRVQSLSVAIARRLGCTGAELDIIGLGALLHDIGKIGVSDRVLRKPGPLSSAEWDEVRRHPELGYRYLKRLTMVDGVADIVRAHHERYDGKGYPLGLAGDAIPLGVRIFAVADAYDAMTSDRPYRRARSHAAAVAEIECNSGTQFDPRVVRAFLEVTATPEAGEPQRAAA